MDQRKQIERSEEAVFTFRHAGDLMGYVKAAVRRRKWLFAGTTVLLVGLAVAAVMALPPKYVSTATVLASDNRDMEALANPDRQMRWGRTGNEAAQSAATLITRQDNLERISSEADLPFRWKQHRPDILRLKDQLTQLVFGPMSEAELEDAVVGVLEDAIEVTSTEEGLVNISTTWSDPETAHRITDLAVQAYLADRRVRENGAIVDTVEVLERHATEQQMRVTSSLDQLRESRVEWARRNGRDPSTMVAAMASDESLAEAQTQLARIDARLSAKRRAIEEVESLQARQIAEMSTRLNELRTQLAPNHPDVVSLRRTIDQYERNPRELERLRAEEASLIRQQQRAEIALGEMGPDGSALRVARAELEGMEPTERDDPDVSYARTRLEMSLAKYEDLLDRISSASIERDIADAAFQYRYAMITPPSTPEEPDGPPVPVVVLAGLMGGLLLGMVSAVGSEALKERILLPWQVERGLGLPFLGEVDRR